MRSKGHMFSHYPYGEVAQRQSRGFISPWWGVQIPLLALQTLDNPGVFSSIVLVSVYAELNPLKSLDLSPESIDLFSNYLEFVFDLFQFTTFRAHKAGIWSDRAFNALDTTLNLFLKLTL